jgi:hypothetical protein
MCCKDIVRQEITVIGVDGCHGGSSTETNAVGKIGLLSICHVSIIVSGLKVYPVTIGISGELQVVRGNPFARRGNLS